jgi:hypothetical protein
MALLRAAPVFFADHFCMIGQDIQQGDNKIDSSVQTKWV